MKKIFLSLTLILLTTTSFAIMESKKITFEEAIQITLRANPRVQIDRLNVASSKNDISIAGHFQNPTIEVMQNLGETGKGDPQKLGASYLVEVFKRGKRRNYATSKAKVAYQHQKSNEQELVLNVKKAYIDLLLKKSKYNILQNQRELSKQLLKSVIDEAQKGKIPQTEVIQAKIAANREIMYLNTAHSEVVFSQNRLNAVMNTSEFNYDTKEDRLTDDYASLNTISPLENGINFDMIKEHALQNRADLLEAREEVETAKNNLKVVKSKLIPDVEISSGYAYQPHALSSEHKTMSGAYVGANLVNIPIVYRYKPEIQNAKLEIEKAELRLEDITIDVIRDLSDAWEKYVIARDNLNFYNKELLSNSRELLKESQKCLSKKEITLTTFLVSKRIYLDLILGYEDALSEYYISWAELLKEVNLSNADIIKYRNNKNNL